MTKVISKAKVLIVEDDDILREVYEMILSGESYDVLTATNGKEALEATEKHSPDLILLDIMMPVMDGSEFLRELRKRPFGQGLPVMIMTNIGASDVPKDVRELHPVSTFIKVDLSPDDLLAKIESQLAATA